MSAADRCLALRDPLLVGTENLAAAASRTVFLRILGGHRAGVFLLRHRAPDRDGLANRLDTGSSHFVQDPFNIGVPLFAVITRDTDLHEAMGIERLADFLQHRVRKAVLPQQNHRIQRVALRAQLQQLLTVNFQFSHIFLNSAVA